MLYLVCRQYTHKHTVKKTSINLNETCLIPVKGAGVHSTPGVHNMAQHWLQRSQGCTGFQLTQKLGTNDCTHCTYQTDLPPGARVSNKHFSLECFSNLTEVNIGSNKVLMPKSNAVPNIAAPAGPTSRELPLPATEVSLNMFVTATIMLLNNHGKR